MKSSDLTPSLTHTRFCARFFFLSARIVNSASVGLSSTSRISTLSNPVILPSCWHGKKESGAPVQFGFGPDSASMAGDQPMNDGEPDPGSGKFVGSVQALEYPEEFVVETHIKAHPIVLHEKSVLRRHEPHFDLGRLSCRTVLQGIRQQVDPDLLEHSRIDVGCRQVLDVS